MSLFRRAKQRLLRLAKPAWAFWRCALLFTNRGRCNPGSPFIWSMIPASMWTSARSTQSHTPTRDCFYRRGWTGINIEPTAGQIDLFKKLRPRDINLACAVAKARGPIRFTTFDQSSVNSADKQMINRQIISGQFHPTGEIVIEAIRLRRFWKLHTSRERADLFIRGRRGNGVGSSGVQ